MDYLHGVELTSTFAMWKLGKSHSSVANPSGTTVVQSLSSGYLFYMFFLCFFNPLDFIVNTLKRNSKQVFVGH